MRTALTIINAVLIVMLLVIPGYANQSVDISTINMSPEQLQQLGILVNNQQISERDATRLYRLETADIGLLTRNDIPFALDNNGLPIFRSDQVRIEKNHR